ncbi:MAG: glycosyltransferase, partial [Gemmatimonadales bacterium]|nr:glycosyltransferase [Gemmatimonadales bacterium]
VTQTVVTGSGGELARRLREDGVRAREVAWRAGLDPRALVGIFAELRGGPALLHAHDAHALTLAGIASWCSGSPLVVTRRVDFHLRRRGFWTRADRVIAISEAVAGVLRADGIDPSRIAVVHSGIDLSAAERAVPLGVRARLGLPAHALVAVSVGALVPHKDHATLLRAAELLEIRCPSLHWIIAGNGPLRPQLERLLDELRLRSRVHLLGQVADPLPLVADADLFVMSSKEEGLGTSVLDAMARGIPVASTAAGGLPEMLGGGAGLLVPPGRPAALADAVARLAGDPELRRELATRGRIAVRRFSAERMAGEVRTVYRSCSPFT